MLFVVLFEDDESRAHMRAQHMTEHLAFLERSTSKIQAAGPLRGSDGKPFGGLWIVQADSPDEVHSLIEDDPFWPTGLRKSFRVLEWTQVFAEGKRKN